jgi:hypothetical protein
MTPTALGIVSSVLLAVAFFLDIRFARSRSTIHDRFLVWWCWFSGLHIRQAIRRSISITTAFFDRVCGRKIFSIGAITRSSLAVATVAALRLAWITRTDTDPILKHALGITLLMLPVILPAVIVLMITRLFLRYAAKRPNSFRLLALGVANLLVVQLGIEISFFSYGVLAQTWIDVAFTNHIPVLDTEYVLATGFAFFFAFSRIYGYLALLPAIIFGVLFSCWILVIVAAAICRIIEEFLRLQVEEVVSRPFTAIAIALCMLLALYSAAARLPYTQIGRYCLTTEHGINRWGFEKGERLIAGPLEKRDQEYILYNLQCQLFLIATEFIGPTIQEIQNLRPLGRKILNEWPKSNETSPPTPVPSIPKK